MQILWNQKYIFSGQKIDCLLLSITNPKKLEWWLPCIFTFKPRNGAVQKLLSLQSTGRKKLFFEKKGGGHFFRKRLGGRDVFKKTFWKSKFKFSKKPFMTSFRGFINVLFYKKQVYKKLDPSRPKIKKKMRGLSSKSYEKFCIRNKNLTCFLWVNKKCQNLIDQSKFTGYLDRLFGKICPKNFAPFLVEKNSSHLFEK